MAVKRIKYSREFESVTSQENVAICGSPVYSPRETHSEEDLRLREKIITKYSLNPLEKIKDNQLIHCTSTNKDIDERTYQGSSQFHNYIFQIWGNPQRFKKGATDKTGPYQTIVSISKSGRESDLETLCDLESFLIDNGFKTISSAH